MELNFQGDDNISFNRRAAAAADQGHADRIGSGHCHHLTLTHSLLQPS